MVLKPAGDTPLSALKLTEILLEAGLPAEAIQTITGSGAEIGDALTGDPRVRKITFTGSMEVGDQICRNAGIKKVTMELGSNSPLIVMNDADIEKVAAASPRLEAMHFGVADYAASCRARTMVIGGLNPDYPGDQWHWALSRMLVACRANGLRAVDGPFGDYGDAEGFTAGARRAAALGYDGKWAIHPSQIDLANEVFTPPQGEIEQARRVLAALEEAAVAGRGAASLDGRMIDAASARMARNVVETADAIAAVNTGSPDT